MSAAVRRALAVGLPLALAALGLTLPGSTGAALLYPALGVVPGLALARALPLEAGPVARLALGLAAAPLVTAVAGWALMSAGMAATPAARTIALAALAAWSLSCLRRTPAAPAREPGARFALAWAAGWAVLVALPLLVNPYLQIRSDSWVHAGITHEILERGIPPEEPRFAGLTLNYVWFYNLFLALASALGGDDPFVLIPWFNAVAIAATLLAAWVLGRRLWGEGGARGCAILAALGFNAGVWLLWPLRLLRALVGDDRGWTDVRFELANLHLGDTRVIWTLSAPFAHMASFLDKFMIGTAVGYAYVLLHLHLWATLAWLAAPGARPLFWLFASAAGMLLIHGVVGLSYLPVALAAFGLTALLSLRWRWLPGFGRLAPAAAATLLGALAAAPYTLAISRGWSGERTGLAHRYFAFDPWMAWTLVSALLVAGWLAWRPVREGLAARSGPHALLALIAAGLALFALVVKLPLGNHVKFVYQAFVPVALFGGVALGAAVRGVRRRLGAAAGAAIVAILLGGHVAFTMAGYFADPHGRTSEELNPSPAERRLFAWARSETPRDAVFLDRDYRSRFMVRAGRQMWLGTRHGPELAAFPAADLAVRNAVLADLYGPLDSLAESVRGLRALGRPVYVVYRPEDPGSAERAERIATAPSPFVRVYDRDGFVVYHLPPPDPPGAAAR